MSSITRISGQTLDPNALRDVMMRGNTDAQKVKQAGTQFEAILVRQFLDKALKPQIKGELSEQESSTASDTYRYFITDTLSQALAARGVFGIGKELSAQLTARAANKDASKEANAQNSPGQIVATGSSSSISSVSSSAPVGSASFPASISSSVSASSSAGNISNIRQADSSNSMKETSKTAHELLKIDKEVDKEKQR